jgi:hypothetical protein
MVNGTATLAAAKDEGPAIFPGVRVLNLNNILAATTITAEDKKLAYKTGRIAEMGLKQAGLQT